MQKFFSCRPIYQLNADKLFLQNFHWNLKFEISNLLSPLAFAEGVMIAIECKAYAQNIVHDSMERRGLAHFEVEQTNTIF